MALPGLRLDLHNHTHFSPDGLMSPAELLAEARSRGIHCLAVTDHNSVEGASEAVALAAADASLPRVIPGIELSTAEGEIVGLYVREDIHPGLPLSEAIARIRDQGGLIYLPHPCDVLRRGAISRGSRSLAAQMADAVEVVNGRSLGPRACNQAARLARRLGKPAGAGSDAHWRGEVGTAYVLIDSYPSRDTLVSLLSRGEVRNCLRPLEYALNWGMQGLAPVTRMRRRVAGDLSRR
jgi:predicted metal-dependent phosphoesterase TrpH